MSPSNNVWVQILSLHGSFLYIAVEQNLELKAKERMEIRKYKSISTWSKSRFSHPLTACQSPLLSDLMLLVNTSNVFQLLWSLLSNIWLFDAYAALVSLPSACLWLVRKKHHKCWFILYPHNSTPSMNDTGLIAFIFARISLKKCFYFFSCLLWAYHWQGQWLGWVVSCRNM